MLKCTQKIPNWQLKTSKGKKLWRLHFFTFNSTSNQNMMDQSEYSWDVMEIR